MQKKLERVSKYSFMVVARKVTDDCWVGLLEQYSPIVLQIG